MCHIINASFRMWDVRTGRAIRTMTGHLVSNHHGKMFTIMISELTPVSYRNVPVSMRSLKMGFQIYVLPVDSRIKIKSSSQVNF